MLLSYCLSSPVQSVDVKIAESAFQTTPMNCSTLCVLHGPMRFFVATNHQENEVPNLD